MSRKTANEKRDYEIYKEIKDIYKLEWERADTLNDKAIRLVGSAGVTMALYVGLGTFTLEHVSTDNFYHPLLVFALMFGLALFIMTIIVGLSAFSIAKYKATDPRDFIEEYKGRDWLELIHFYGGDLRNAILENRRTNDSKVNQIRMALFSLTTGAITILTYAVLMVLALG